MKDTFSVKLHTKDLSNLSFLVTGGAGFIGSHITEYLLGAGAGHVRVLDDLSTGFEKNISPFKAYTNFRFIQGSITDPAICQEACKGVNVVLHQAALGSVPRSVENPIRTNEVNVSGFVNMLFAAKKNGVQKFVYASSSSVYGDDATYPKIEGKTGNLLSPYAVSKHANEEYGKVFASLYGMQVIGLRYFNVFGPRQTPNGPYAAVIPKFISSLLRQEAPHIYGTGNNTRDFTYVANVVRANMLCIESTKILAGIIMNIACGGTISINAIYKNITGYLQSNINPEYKPERLGEIKDSYANIDLAQSIIGYTPLISLEEGLKRTVEWHLNNRH